MNKEIQTTSTKRKFLTAILLVLFAIAGISAITFAWFSLSDNAGVSSFTFDITNGKSLRMDLTAHEKYEDYVKTLGFGDITNYIEKTQGYKFSESALDPVTTDDCVSFRLEDGTLVNKESGKYLEFTLHFMSEADMLVHLTSENSDGAQDGTLIYSSKPTLAAAMRISFSADDETKVYNPGLNAGELSSINNQFTLPNESEMEYNKQNTLFALKAYEDKPVTIRVWMEGTDPACEDSLKNADYSIRLRFFGTDENNNKFLE